MIKVLRNARRVPPEYEKLILDIGGTNLFGEPNFKLVWGESHVDNTAFGPMVLCPLPCWILMEWHAADEYGPPSLWPHDVCGAYPIRGRYEFVQPFYRVENKEFLPMELNRLTFEVILPIILKHRHDSGEKRLALMKEMKEKHDNALEDRIADNLQDSMPVTTESISFHGQTNKNSYVQQMIDRMEAQARTSFRLNKGIQQVN